MTKKRTIKKKKRTPKSSFKVGILGYGEVGQAIAKFYKKPLIRDLDKNEFVENMHILHVCIPYSEDFTKIVQDNIREYKPQAVIIHSTVKPGTTWTIFRNFPIVAHSPVRGVHPELYNSIKTFVKFVGCDNFQLGRAIVKHFKDLKIKAEFIGGSRVTEIAKLASTTYYGLCIAYHDYINNICEKEGLSMDAIMTRFNETYNEGYAKLGKKNVIRPVLTPPQGKIGGHCIIPNAELLKESFGENELLSAILKLK